MVKENKMSDLCSRLAACATIFALSACATDRSTSAIKMDSILAQQTGQDGRACIRTSMIRGYAVEDDLIKIRTSRKYYVASTLYRCHDLDLAPRAAFDSRFPEACAHSSYIVTRDSRCPIKNIFEFNNRDEAFAAIESAQARLIELKEESKQGMSATTEN